MKKLALIFVILSVCYVSCQKEYQDINEIQIEKDVRENRYSISVSEALSKLQGFLDSEGNLENKTKATSNRKITSVQTISLNSPKTRAFSTELDCDNLLYLVNFEDNGGFAILAADSRIPADILSVTEQGNLDSEVLYTALESTLTPPTLQRLLYAEYPLEGPGIFYSDDGNDMLLNANTFDLYDTAEDDDYIVDFDNSELHAINDPQIPYEPEIENMICNLAVEYSLDAIGGFEPPVDTLPGDNWTTKVETIVTYQQRVAPMLEFAKDWNQKSPFNDAFPKVRAGWIVGNRKRAAAGCVPLSIAKIMTYNEFPSSMSYNGVQIDWTALKTDYHSAGQSPTQLCLKIAKSSSSLFFYEGTFTLPSKAKQFMTSVGYSGVQYNNYSTSTVTAALDRRKPLMVSSIPGKFMPNVFESHAWNIDGYKNKITSTKTDYYDNGVYKYSKTSSPVSTVMVHCDFGWSGSCNGYFVSGMFDMKRNDVEYDSEYHFGNKYNFKYYLKTITYN